MPHSPLIKAVRAPISLLQRYKTDLGHHRRAIEAGEIDTSREDYLLELGQDLFDHCEFLEDKLDAKVIDPRTRRYQRNPAHALHRSSNVTK